jgi:hypothetical protein
MSTPVAELTIDIETAEASAVRTDFDLDFAVDLPSLDIGVPGPPGPPGGGVDLDDYALVTYVDEQDDAIEVQLEPPIDLVVLFLNALA